ncbi:MAG: hypothetical protein JO269_12585 [Burkholderiaceae bacterium]|nr:hypothetical protein [Burkholderiaceae bacterium]
MSFAPVKNLSDKSVQSVRFLFSHGALFNLSAGILLITASLNASVARLIGLKVVTDLWAAQFVGLTVLVFGWIYWTIGRNPVKNRDMIQFGLIGKSLTVLVIGGHFLLGNLTWQAPALASFDAMYTVLFWRALSRLKHG